MSIKLKLTLSTITVFLVLVIIIGSVLLSVIKTSLVSEARYDAGKVCNEAAYSIEKSVMSDIQIIKTLASSGITPDTVIEKMPILESSVRFSQFEYIALQLNDEWYKITGDSYESVPAPFGISHDIFSDVIFGYVFEGEEEGVLVIESIASAGSGNGKLIAKRSIDWLKSVMATDDVQADSSVVLSKTNGQTIYPESDDSTVSVFSGSISDGNAPLTGNDNSDNVVSIKLNNVPLYASTYVDYAAVSDKLNQYILYFVIFALCGLFFISGVVYLISFLLTQSIIDLAKFTEQYELTGNCIPYKFTRRSDEAGVLARSFALMTNKLSGTMGKMKHMAYHDSLTGLKNRYSMERDIDELLNAKKPFAFALLDIDDFKIINDMMGHAEGDRLLKCIARIFESLVSDTLDVYRWGGDEFAFLLKGHTIESYREDIERVLSEVSSRFDSSNKWRISVSAGICTYPKSAMDYSKLLVLADQALILAKRSGKARYRFYEDI